MHPFLESGSGHRDTTVQWKLKQVVSFILEGTTLNEPFDKGNILVMLNICQPVLELIAGFAGRNYKLGVNAISGYKPAKDPSLALIERKLTTTFQRRCSEDGMWFMPPPASEQWATTVLCAIYLWLGFLWLPRRLWGGQLGQNYRVVRCGHSAQHAAA
jgi:hypothetical protein